MSTLFDQVFVEVGDKRLMGGRVLDREFGNVSRAAKLHRFAGGRRVFALGVHRFLVVGLTPAADGTRLDVAIADQGFGIFLQCSIPVRAFPYHGQSTVGDVLL